MADKLGTSFGKFQSASHFLLTLICVMCLSAVPQLACADSNGEFPGLGDRAAWQRAWDLYEDKAIQLRKQGKARESIPLHKRAIETYRYDSSIYYNYALSLEDVGDFSAAEAQYKAGIGFERKNFGCWYNLGILQFKRAAYADAKKTFGEALKYADSEKRKTKTANYLNEIDQKLKVGR